MTFQATGIEHDGMAASSMLMTADACSLSSCWSLHAFTEVAPRQKASLKHVLECDQQGSLEYSAMASMHLSQFCSHATELVCVSSLVYAKAAFCQYAQ